MAKKKIKRNIFRVHFKKILYTNYQQTIECCAISKVEQIEYGKSLDYLILPSEFNGMPIKGILQKISRWSLSCILPNKLDFIFVQQYDNLVQWDGLHNGLPPLNFYVHQIGNVDNRYFNLSSIGHKNIDNKKIESYAELHDFLDKKKTKFAFEKSIEHDKNYIRKNGRLPISWTFINNDDKKIRDKMILTRHPNDILSNEAKIIEPSFQIVILEDLGYLDLEGSVYKLNNPKGLILKESTDEDIALQKENSANNTILEKEPIEETNKIISRILKILMYVLLSPYYLIKYIVIGIIKLFGLIFDSDSKVLKIASIAIPIILLIVLIAPPILDVIDFPINPKIKDEGLKYDEEVCSWSTIKYEGEFNGCNYESAYRECLKHGERQDIYSDLTLMGHTFNPENKCEKCQYELSFNLENLEYIVHDEYVEVIGFKNVDIDTRIPSYIKGLPVTKVELFSFNGKCDLSPSIDIYTLEYFAPTGYDCYISLPTIEINELHLYGDIKILDSNIDIPNNANSVDTYNELSKVKKIYVYDQIETIKSMTFGPRISIHDVNSLYIFGGITNIEVKAFYNCNFKEITLTKDCTNISQTAFFTPTYGPIDINVADDNPNYSSIDGVLCSKDKKKLIVYPSGRKADTYILPDSIEVIDINAFGGYTPNIYVNKMPIIDFTNPLYKCEKDHTYIFNFNLTSDVKEFNFDNIIDCIEHYGVNENGRSKVSFKIDLSLNSGKNTEWIVSSSTDSSLSSKVITSNYYDGYSRTLWRIKEDKSTVKWINASFSGTDLDLYELYQQGYDTFARE